MYRNSFKSWPSNSIGESSILIHQVCGFGLWSHHIEESTNECFHKWNKSMSLPLSKISKWKKYLFTFKERKGGRKKGRETSVCERYINWLPLTHPQLRTWPTTQACALTGNWTSYPFPGWHSIHWATPARVVRENIFLINSKWIKPKCKAQRYKTLRKTQQENIIAGFPNLWAEHQYQSGRIRNQATPQEVSLNVMRLNHPKTTPPLWSVEKLSSTKLVPGAKKVGNCCFITLDLAMIS